jgi:uncharacterized protein (DUF58 family)
MIGRYLHGIWLSPLFFTTLATAIFLCAFGFAFPFLFRLGQVLVGVVLILSVADFIILFSNRFGLEGKRVMPSVLGLTDETEIKLELLFRSPMALRAELYEELPFSLQERHFTMTHTLNPGRNEWTYSIRPINRGTYRFGKTQVLVEGPLHFIKRRFSLPLSEDVSVYPSIKQMHETELLAFSRVATPTGHKRYKRIGRSYEFEQISPFVEGDDYRNINWKATGKTRELMVNQYQDERSQNLYCIISKGRAMKMAFRHVTYLDYSINATLALSNVALKKYDKVGLITFSNKIGTALRAENRSGQIRKILDALHREEERQFEPDFELLYRSVDRLAKNRSLIVLFANFESKHTAERALPLLKKISRKHLLVMVLFEDSELTEIAERPKQDVEDVYRVTLAANQLIERKEVVNRLRNQGIHTLFCTPERLSVEVINKYLELKAKGMI